MVSQTSIVVSCRLQPRPWRQRRAKDHGHRRRCALYGWFHVQVGHAWEVGPLPLAHHPRRPCCHRCRNVFRRMAHRPHNGQKITKLKPIGGFCAESAGAITLFGTALAGIPVSTTHTITGAIVGVGSLHRPSAVRWGVAGRIVWAWILTIPASAVVAGGTFLLIHVIHPS